MKEFAYVAKNMFNFKGRARRREYWISQLMNIGILYAVFGFVFFILGFSLKGLKPDAEPGILTTIGCIFAIIIMFVVAIWSFLYNLAVTVRRLHDRNLSGWIYLACIAGAMCCGIGSIVLLVLLCLDGTEGENKYGANPKELPGADDNGSVVPAIVFPIAGFILFIIGYVSIFFNAISATGGWNSFIRAFTDDLYNNQNVYEKEYDDLLDDIEDVVEDVTVEDKDDTEATEEVTTEAVETNAATNGDAPENVVSGTSLTSPAKIGDWIPTMLYSTVDSKDHTAYFRITDIVTGEEVDKAIEEYNSEGYMTIEPLEKEDLEYRLIKYEVYIPTDFPTQEWGLSSADIDFDITDEDEGGIEYEGVSYIGLTAYDISKYIESAELMPGDTYTEGRALMTMIKGYDNYIIEQYNYTDEGETISEYIKGK